MSARGTLGKKPRRGPQVPGCGPSRGGARLAEHAGSGERGALEDPAGELDTRSLRRPRCGVGHQAGAIEAALAACLEQAAPLPNLSKVCESVVLLGHQPGRWVTRVLDRARVLPAKYGTCHRYFTHDIGALCQFQRLC